MKIYHFLYLRIKPSFGSQIQSQPISAFLCFLRMIPYVMPCKIITKPHIFITYFKCFNAPPVRDFLRTPSHLFPQFASCLIGPLILSSIFGCPNSGQETCYCCKRGRRQVHDSWRSFTTPWLGCQIPRQCLWWMVCETPGGRRFIERAVAKQSQVCSN